MRMVNGVNFKDRKKVLSKKSRIIKMSRQLNFMLCVCMLLNNTLLLLLLLLFVSLCG